MVIELRDDMLAPIDVKHQYAVVAITKHGVDIARRLHANFPNTDVYYMSKFEIACACYFQRCSNSMMASLRLFRLEPLSA